jgi:DNA polymerase-1
MQNSPKTDTPPGPGPLLIVDGHCYAYRAFYGITSLTSPTGRPVNAIYGFIRMLEKMRERLRPSRLVVVWDGGLAESRKALWPEYKAQRPELPAGLATQLDDMVEFLHAAGICSLCMDGCEADDCIAVLASQAEAANLPTVIASSDKDFMQLVSENVRLLVPQDKTETLWDSAQVKQKTGVEPTQIVDWLSLIGDAVDNIPGVEGVGPKTAADLLGKFGSIDVVYSRLGEVSSERVRSRLQVAEEAVRRNQQLIRLHSSIACDVSLDDLELRDAKAEELRQLFTVWGFKKMLQSLDELLGKTEDLFHEQTHAG